MKYLTLLLFTFLMYNGVSQTNIDKANSKDQPACKVKVSFGSPGTGIDGKTYDAVMALIQKKKLKYSEKHMGREGETEICLPLSELKKSKKNEFIEQLKKTASSGQLVSVSVN